MAKKNRTTWKTRKSWKNRKSKTCKRHTKNKGRGACQGTTFSHKPRRRVNILPKIDESDLDFEAAANELDNPVIFETKIKSIPKYSEKVVVPFIQEADLPAVQVLPPVTRRSRSKYSNNSITPIFDGLQLLQKQSNNTQNKQPSISPPASSLYIIDELQKSESKSPRRKPPTPKRNATKKQPPAFEPVPLLTEQFIAPPLLPPTLKELRTAHRSIASENKIKDMEKTITNLQNKLNRLYIDIETNPIKFGRQNIKDGYTKMINATTKELEKTTEKLTKYLKNN